MRHTIVFHTIALAKRLQNAIGFKAPPLNLSYSQATALLVIDSQKETSQREIAVRLHLKPPSVVSLIDELEKFKLVKRGSLDDDRRKYRITLTEEGTAKVKLIKNRASQLDKYLKNELSKNENDIYFQILEKLTAYLADWKGGEHEIPSTKRYLAT